MQSVDACACFVRVGRCCLGSILGSILESFWEPGGPLYSFGGPSGAILGVKSGGPLWGSPGGPHVEGGEDVSFCVNLYVNF